MNRLNLALLLCLAASPAAASNKASYMHYIRGLLLQEKGLYAETLKEFQTVIGLDPQAPYVLAQAAELALDIGQPAAALNFAKQFAALEPKNPKARFVLGNVLWAQGELAAAKTSFLQALKLDPSNQEVLFALGNLLSTSEPDKARSYYQRYLETNAEGSPEVLYQMSLLDQRSGRDARAIGDLKRAIELEPDYLQARYALAQLYEIEKDTAAALGVYQDILPRDPRNIALLDHIGELQFARGQVDAAKAAFDQAKAVDPSNPAACFWKAFLEEQKGRWAQAAAELKASSALDNDPATAMRLSYYLTQAGRLGEAVAILVQAHQKWPKNPEIPYFLGLGYDDQGQTAKALQAMSDAVALTPSSREARFQLAALQEKAGDLAGMERNFNILLAAHPDDASALNYFGYSLADRGLRLQEAKAMIEKAVSLDPGNGAYVDSLGWADFKLGDHQRALQELKRAAALIGDDESVWMHLGQAYAAAGDPEGAWSSYRLSQFLKPTRADDLAGRIRREEGLLSPEALGRLWLRLLKRTHGGFKEFNSLCEVEGTVLNHEFSFSGLLQYKQGEDFKLQVLGPLFLPLWRLTVHAGRADLGGLKLAGVPEDKLSPAVSRSLLLLADFFTGKLYAPSGAAYHRGWLKSYVETPEAALFLVEREARLKSWRPREERNLKLELAAPNRLRGHLLPGQFNIEGPGFTLRIKLNRIAAEFLPDGD